MEQDENSEESASEDDADSPTSGNWSGVWWEITKLQRGSDPYSQQVRSLTGDSRRIGRRDIYTRID